MKSLPYLLFVLALIGLVLFVVYYQSHSGPKKIFLDDGTVLTLLEIEKTETEDKNIPEVLYEGNYFTHERYGFSLLVPDGFDGVEQKVGKASATLFFRDSLDASKSFQIFVTPYGKTNIPKERFEQDLGIDASVANIQEITLGEQDIPALAFENTSPALGTLREVWFVHNDFLYEFSASITNDEMLLLVMQTLDFSSG